MNNDETVLEASYRIVEEQLRTHRSNLARTALFVLAAPPETFDMCYYAADSDEGNAIFM